ncbi:MAG: hypothetical protein H6774_00850 [Pseudomonadales bacterium]|nr:hypothetical protein [Candidatus Woesebacteria bacterium]MCB9801614.1 hypothetical protein [Pseudomonadales bacterium]
MLKPQSEALASTSVPARSHMVYYKPRKTVLLDNFLGGVFWGLGSGIGATVVIAVVGYLLAQTTELPFIGQIIQNVMRSVGSSQ